MVCIFWKVSNEKSWGSGLDTIIETNSGVVVKCKCDGGMPNTKATTIKKQKYFYSGNRDKIAKAIKQAFLDVHGAMRKELGESRSENH
jgi:hypothetical protein